MDAPQSSQLDKVLALADSNFEGEAIVAVRKARQLLSRNGLSFSDLARAAAAHRPRINFPFSMFSTQHVQLEARFSALNQKIADLESKLSEQIYQADYWRKRAQDLEQSLTLSNSQALRWRELAKETVEKLWDLGQSMRSDEFTTEEPAAKTAADKNKTKQKSA